MREKSATPEPEVGFVERRYGFKMFAVICG
jgi:hypothetical protein